MTSGDSELLVVDKHRALFSAAIVLTYACLRRMNYLGRLFLTVEG